MGSDGMTQEQTAFLRQLYMDYADKLAQNAFRHTGDEELAADLVQEVFVTAIMRIEDVYKLSANPRPWLYKVLNNLMRRELAKAHHTREIPISEETQLGAVELEVPYELCGDRGTARHVGGRLPPVREPHHGKVSAAS